MEMLVLFRAEVAQASLRFSSRSLAIVAALYRHILDTLLSEKKNSSFTGVITCNIELADIL